tara:strand:- start:13 stop:873 length:861 start_codon:yes stop_codon:yes gene_type:complete
MSESDGVNFSHTKTIKTIFGKDIFIGGHSHPIYVWSGKSILLCILIYSIILFLASSPAFNKFMIFIYSIVTVLISFCLSSYLKHDLQKHGNLYFMSRNYFNFINDAVYVLVGLIFALWIFQSILIFNEHYLKGFYDLGQKIHYFDSFFRSCVEPGSKKCLYNFAVNALALKYAIILFIFCVCVLISFIVNFKRISYNLFDIWSNLSVVVFLSSSIVVFSVHIKDVLFGVIPNVEYYIGREVIFNFKLLGQSIFVFSLFIVMVSFCFASLASAICITLSALGRSRND